MKTFLYNLYVSEYYFIGRRLSFLMVIINESFQELRKDLVFRSVFYAFGAIIKNINTML